eukprot:11009675-Lingulodinium_polyedra.AAC.1
MSPARAPCTLATVALVPVSRIVAAASLTAAMTFRRLGASPALVPCPCFLAAFFFRSTARTRAGFLLICARGGRR